MASHKPGGLSRVRTRDKLDIQFKRQHYYFRRKTYEE